MDWATPNDIGLFALRASLAYVYLHAGWMISRNSGKRHQTARRTAVLLDRTPLAGNEAAASFLAYAAFAMIYLGSLGVLLGLAVPMAAALLIVFTAPGIVVHLRERDQSLKLVDTVAGGSGGDPAATGLLRVSAYAAHQSSANKNYALIGACLFLILAEDPVGSIALAALW